MSGAPGDLFFDETEIISVVLSVLFFDQVVRISEVLGVLLYDEAKESSDPLKCFC